jgi:hypothetical protein
MLLEIEFESGGFVEFDLFFVENENIFSNS